MSEKTPPPEALGSLEQPFAEIGGEKKTGKKWMGRIASFVTEKWKKASSYVEQKVSAAKSHIFHKEQQASKTFSMEKPKSPLPQATRVQRVGVLVLPPVPSSRKGAPSLSAEEGVVSSQKEEVKKRYFSSQKPLSLSQLLSDFSMKESHSLYEIRELDDQLKKGFPNPLDKPEEWNKLITENLSLVSVLTSIRISAIRQRILDSYGEWIGAATAVKYASPGGVREAKRVESDNKLDSLKKDLNQARKFLQTMKETDEKKSFEIFLGKIEKAMSKFIEG